MKSLHKNPNSILYLMCIPYILTIGISIYSLITRDFPKLGVINGGLLLSPFIIMSAYKSSSFKSLVKFYKIFFILFSIPYIYLAFTGSILDKLSSIIYGLTTLGTYIVIDYLNNKRTESENY